jgi:uncharacterized delta-60 repeat protein
VRRIVFLLSVVLIGAIPNAAADGMLDPSFGNGGLVVTPFPGPVSQDRALSLVVLPDGRAVAAGSTLINLENQDMAVARYLFSGALDPTFDVDGEATVHFPGAPPFFGSYSAAESVLLQPDGRVVLVGAGSNDAGPFFALARLNTDGSPDPSFGTGGLVMAPTGQGAQAGLLQPDGRIIAAGSDAGTAIVVVRYNPDGSLDATFGNNGTVNVPGSFFVDVEGAALQADGKVVIAGTSQSGGFLTRNFGLVRLLPNGALDLSFDGDGIVISDFGGMETSYSVIVLGDGRLVLAGSRGTELPNEIRDLALARYLPDGSLDTTFGNGGLVLVDAAPSEDAHQLIELPNGKLLVAGATYGQFDPLDFLLVRLLPNGSIDTSFGRRGVLLTDFNTGSDECNAVALAGPDLVLTAGSTTTPPSPIPNFGLARYIASTPVELLTFSVE